MFDIDVLTSASLEMGRTYSKTVDNVLVSLVIVNGVGSVFMGCFTKNIRLYKKTLTYFSIGDPFHVVISIPHAHTHI